MPPEALENGVRAQPVTLWRNRDYMVLWGGQAISTLGSGISQLAYPFLILNLTDSPAQAGFVGAMFLFPYLLISLPAGALVDRWNRKRLMILCDAVRTVNMGSIPLAAALGHLSIVQLYVTAAIEGTAFVFFNVAEVAALPRVVDKSQIPEASSQNQAAQAAGALISPPLGGFLFQTVGHVFPFLADAISYAASVLSLLLIRTEFQLERSVEQRHLLTEIREGVAWLWNQPLIRYMTFLTGGLNFVGNATFLILLILARQHGASPALTGVMFAITAVGGLAGALLAPRFQRRFGYAQVIVTTVWIQAVATLFFAVAPNIFVLGALGAITFLRGPIFNAVQFSYRVSLIPDALQGRVNSVVRMVAFGTIPPGTALAGVLIQGVGAVRTVLAFAGVTFLLAVLTTGNRHIRAATSAVPDTIPA
ncbi:MAG TPA: MFS transporter [Chloroflexota bacterium]|nr:MFS transporter [Chloroflexota bacterium]